MEKILGILEYREQAIKGVNTCFDTNRKVFYKSKAIFYPCNGQTVYHTIFNEFLIIADENIISGEVFKYERIWYFYNCTH